jgi:hypothetical protein
MGSGISKIRPHLRAGGFERQKQHSLLDSVSGKMRPTREEFVMRPDRPLILAVASLATGVGLIVAYCHGATSMNVAYPFAGSVLHIDLTTYGPAVLGGLALTALGVLLLAWSVLAAFVHQISLLVSREDRMESIRSEDILDRRREASFADERYPGSLGLSERRHEG